MRMTKYKCASCGACFKEEEADEGKELIDHFSGYGNYYEKYYKCPECGESDLEELILDKECIEYEDEFGCEGDCEDCPLMKGDEADNETDN